MSIDREADGEWGRVVGADPLILTAAFDETTAATLQRLRDRHFPSRLNIVPAHLTLFHHLPGVQMAAIAQTLQAHCGTRAALPIRSAGLRFLGRGVAVAIEAPGLLDLHRELASLWREALTAQDRQGFKPHVTVQNKVDPATARALLARLEAEGVLLAGTITGLRLWHYRGGPWEPAGRFAFGGDDVAS